MSSTDEGSGSPPSRMRRAYSRFVRTRADRYLGGVSGGLARSLNVDPLVVRVGFVMATLWWRATPLLYATLWLFVREEGADHSLAGACLRPGGFRPAAGIAALGIGAAVLAPGGSTQMRVGVALLAAGAVLVLRRPGQPDEAQPVAKQPDLEPPDPAQESSATSSRPLRATPSEPREPAWLSRLGLSFVALVLAISVGLDRSDVVVRPGVVVALCLLLVAVGLLIGAWWGRARLLVLVGLALVPLWLGFSASAIPRFDGDGTERHVPRSLDQLADRYTQGYGDLRVDLTHLSLRHDQTIKLALGVTAGSIEVRVPEEVDIEVAGEVGLGNAIVVRQDEGEYGYGRHTDADAGLLINRDPDLRSLASDLGCELMELPGGETGYRDFRDEPCEPGSAAETRPRLKLDIELGIGSVEVERVQTST